MTIMLMENASEVFNSIQRAFEVFPLSLNDVLSDKGIVSCSYEICIHTDSNEHSET